MPLGERDLERPADHHRDHASSDIVRGLERPLADAVAEHGDAVGDAEHLGQPVADVDDADAGARLLEHELVEALAPPRGPSAVVGSSRSSTFGRVEQRLHHLEELPLRERERSGRRADGTSSSNCASWPLAQSVHLARTAAAGSSGHGEIEVLGDRQVEDVRVV